MAEFKIRKNVLVEARIRSHVISAAVPPGCTAVGYAAFECCASLISVTLPASCVSVGQQAFAGCTGLTSMTFPAGFTSVGTAAFSWCPALTSVTLPASCVSVGKEAFRECTGVTSVTFRGCTSVGLCAFYGCTGLTSVILITPSATKYSTALTDFPPLAFVAWAMSASRRAIDAPRRTHWNLTSVKRRIADYCAPQYHYDTLTCRADFSRWPDSSGDCESAFNGCTGLGF